MLATSSPSHPTAMPTASGYLALLQEPSPQLQKHALEKLLQVVDSCWHEVAEALPDLEAMAEGDGPEKQLAAAVASRVFFHLEEPQQALRLALLAGDEYFDYSSSSPYMERLVRAALDAYIEQTSRSQDSDADMNKDVEELPLATLEPLVYRLLDVALEQGQYKQALGIALESKQSQKVQLILKKDPSLSGYTFQATTSLVTDKEFRNIVLNLVAACLSQQFDAGTNLPASVDLVLVHQWLLQPEPVAQVLTCLLESDDETKNLWAYQLCFDLMDSGNQAYCQAVASHITLDAQGNEHWKQAKRVLSDGFSSELSLSFLHKNSQSDVKIMQDLKKSLEERGSGGRNSILHNAAVMTHAYLNAGTTNDAFLRDHLDWMKKASNWAKFSATASLGVVHAGHITEAMNLLQPYLPAEPSADTTVATTGGYAEGGSLYALGLIHGSGASSSTQRLEVNNLLRSHLHASHANEVISHGAALGVGLTAMGSANVEIVSELKELLYTDSAVAGEAAGIAMGMVLVGTGAGNTHPSLPAGSNVAAIQEVVIELKNYARETQHEKIIRGIAMGLALMNFGQEEGADALIEELRSDRDPILRYGAQYALSLAYCGTGSNKAIRILLHTAVSDVSDDVRMAAVIGLAFVLYKTPERVPQLVKLLLESFNPHVRYASCMAVGIAMAGTGDAESIALLEPMLEDMTDYVRQGALMGTSMIYMQQSDSCNGNKKIRTFREKLSTILSDKHQSTLTKMGAILSKGLMDIGGRNCTIDFGSRNGFTKMTSVVGITMWLQHWHWYPMMHMLSLGLTPTYTIGLNKDFKYPKSFEIQCHSKPSQYAYPKKVEEKKEEKKKRVETVTLSTTAKNKARMARKNKGKDGMDISTKMDDSDMKTDESEAPAKDDEKKDGDDMEVEAEEPTKKKKKREPEPLSFRIQNPARITKSQSKVCEFDLDQRYRPVRPEEKPFGVVILTDMNPKEEDAELGAINAPSMEPEGECPPPQPFEWTAPTDEEATMADAAAPAAETSTSDKKE